MSDILLEEQSTPATPSAGQGIVYIDSTSSKLSFVDDAGRKYVVTGGGLTNSSIAALTVNAADTYLIDSDLLIPSFGVQARTRFTWNVSASKTAAGVAQPIYNVRIGSARSVAGDTARLVLTGPAQTAIADIGTLTIMVTVRSVGAAGVIQGTAFWAHRGTAASTTVSGVGFANDTTGHVEGTSAGFDNSALGGSFIGISVNSGTAGVWTVTQVHATAEF
jgi:hypothetical protein